MAKKEKMLPFTKEVRVISDQLVNNENASDEELVEYFYECFPNIKLEDLCEIVNRERQSAMTIFPYYLDLHEITGNNSTIEYYTPEQETLFYASF